jgi:TonB family protein
MARTETRRGLGASDFLLSFTGHVLVVGVVALLGIGKIARDARRPVVFSVSIVGGGGTPLPQGASKGTTLVESKPKSQVKAPPTAQSKTQSKAQPKTSTQAGTGSGSSTLKRQGLGVGVEGAEALGYSYYLNAMLTRVSDNWLNPYAGQAKVLTATVVFVIERDGTVKEVKVEKKSGDAAYDESCERALLVTDKLPPLPPEFAGPRLKLHLEFEQKP